MDYPTHVHVRMRARPHVNKLFDVSNLLFYSKVSQEIHLLDYQMDYIPLMADLLLMD